MPRNSKNKLRTTKNLEVLFSDTGPVCFENQTDFDAFCNETFYGRTNGGQCYFFGGKRISWQRSWAVCRQYGTVPVMVHTKREYDTVTKFFLVRTSNNFNFFFRFEAKYSLQQINTVWMQIPDCLEFCAVHTKFKLSGARPTNRKLNFMQSASCRRSS